MKYFFPTYFSCYYYYYQNYCYHCQIYSGGAAQTAPLIKMNPRCPRALRAWITNPEPPATNDPLKLFLCLRVKIINKIKSKIIITYALFSPSSPITLLAAHPVTTGTRVPGDNDPGFPQYNLDIPTPMGPANFYKTYPHTTTDALTICDQRHSKDHFVTTTFISTAAHPILSFFSGYWPWQEGLHPLHTTPFPLLVTQGNLAPLEVGIRIRKNKKDTTKFLCLETLVHEGKTGMATTTIS